ncbi:MAG: transglutaminase-like domain-containing protein [Bacteroidota bacterium]
MEEYLKPAKYIDSDHTEIINFVNKHIDTSKSQKENIVILYYAIRDGWRYDPYKLDFSDSGLKASNLFSRNHAYCIEKAALLAASARICNIPSRLGFANVRNHIGTTKYEEILGSDILVFHGYTELFLEGNWLKATPAFNKELCKHLGVQPLDFDGETDSIFQEYDNQGGRYMEYLKDHGHFSDIPKEKLLTELRREYPLCFEYPTLDTHGISITF